jgi:twitching motility two-component system response regulator PilH
MSKILIVDDSPAQLQSLCKIVEMGGHQAVTAESGEAALELATDEHPELILMDIVMPGMSGYQTTRKLNSNESRSFWCLQKTVKRTVHGDCARVQPNT